MVITQEKLTGPLPPFEPPTCDDTGRCGNFTQPIHECCVCGFWSMDHRLFTVVMVAGHPARQCRDFGRCVRRVRAS